MNGVRIALMALGVALAGAPAVYAQEPTTAARPAGEIMLTDLDVNWEYQSLGTVSAIVHQTALLTKKPMMTALNDAMRAEAAKLGADAVILITYDPGSPFNKKGFRAEGRAVKFKVQPEQYYADGAPAGAAPSPAAPMAPQESAPPQQSASRYGSSGYVYGTPEPATPPQAVASAPPRSTSAPTPAPSSGFTPRLGSSGYAYGAPDPAAPSVVATMTPPAASAPIARAPTPEAMIILSDQDITYRRYTIIGDVSATVHQTSLMRKIPIRTDLDRAIRAEAAKLGADAVVKIDYSDGSLMNKKGFSGTGKAVKFN